MGIQMKTTKARIGDSELPFYHFKDPEDGKDQEEVGENDDGAQDDVHE